MRLPGPDLRPRHLRRRMPSPSIFPTPEGTHVFCRSAVNTSVLRVFSYAETERRQTFCGPTSLAIVMNSLGVKDPTPASLFPYHLVTQDVVFTPANQAVKSFEDVEKSGVTLDQLAQFANNLKLSASAVHAADLSAADMRARLIAAVGQPDTRVIVNFSRASLGQEGEGHFSPLVAYDAASNSFLILDVARYKYPPAWVTATGARYQPEDDGSHVRFVARRLDRNPVGGPQLTAVHFPPFPDEAPHFGPLVGVGAPFGSRWHRGRDHSEVGHDVVLQSRRGNGIRRRILGSAMPLQDPKSGALGMDRARCAAQQILETTEAYKRSFRAALRVQNP